MNVWRPGGAAVVVIKLFVSLRALITISINEFGSIDLIDPHLLVADWGPTAGHRAETNRQPGSKHVKNKNQYTAVPGTVLEFFLHIYFFKFFNSVWAIEELVIT